MACWEERRSLEMAVLSVTQAAAPQGVPSYPTAASLVLLRCSGCLLVPTHTQALGLPRTQEKLGTWFLWARPWFRGCTRLEEGTSFPAKRLGLGWGQGHLDKHAPCERFIDVECRARIWEPWWFLKCILRKYRVQVSFRSRGRENGRNCLYKSLSPKQNSSNG